MLADTLAVAWKELQILSRDRGQLAVLFMMPVLFAAVIGSAFSGGSPGIQAFLVNQDTGPYSAQVVDILEQIDVLRLTELETVEEADQRVADGEALGAIVIPQGFDQAIDTFGRTHVRVIVDPTQQQYGSIVVGILNEVLAPVILQGEIKHGIQVVLDESGVFDAGDESARRMIEAQTLGVVMTRLREAFENPTIAVQSEDLEGVRSQSLDSGYEYTTPSYAVMFAFFIVGTIASSLLREREEGTFRRLMASPIHRAALIAGTIVAYMLVVGLQVLVVLSVGRIFFDISLGDSPPGLVLVTAALAWAAASMGMLVAALARSRSQADGIGVVLGLVLAAVGGAVVPIPGDGFLHILSQFTPHAHAVKAYVDLMARGAGVLDVLPQLGLLLAVGCVFFGIALWRFRFE